MRLRNLPFSTASIASTAAVAAVLGLSTLALPAATSQPPLPYFVEEEMTITAKAEPAIEVALRPVRDGFLAGEPVTLEASLRNATDSPVAVSAAGVYDLAIERDGASKPSDMTLLALAEAGGADCFVIAPGRTVTRLVKLGSDQPFDRPGRYRVSGSWLGGEQPVSVEPFDVVIEDSAAIAQKSGARRNPGA